MFLQEYVQAFELTYNNVCLLTLLINLFCQLWSIKCVPKYFLIIIILLGLYEAQSIIYSPTSVFPYQSKCTSSIDDIFK